MPRGALPVLLALLLAVGLVACGDDRQDTAAAGGEADQEQTATPTPSPVEGAAGCESVAEPEPKGEQSRPDPTTELDPEVRFVATVLTSCGEFEITLDAERAPKTTGAFVELARDGFYDGTIFHRVVPGFVIQGGDPLGTGEGGPGFSVVEAPPKDLEYTKGVVAMAKTPVEDPGTSGSQFFVVTAEVADLPPEYALLGEITEGMEVVERIAAVDVASERPVEPVVIRQVRIEAR